MTTLKLMKLFLPLCAVAAMFSLNAFADDSGSVTAPVSKPIDVTSLTSLAESDLNFKNDTVAIRYNGAMLNFEVSRSEFFMKNKLTGESNIESLVDELGSAEEMRQFIHDEDSLWGQDCKMVLYKADLPKTDENRLLLTNKIEIVLDTEVLDTEVANMEVANMELLQTLAAAVGVEVGSKQIGGNGSAWLQANCGGSAIKAAEILSKHESVKSARPMTVFPLVKCSIPTDNFYTPGDQNYVHHEQFGLVANVQVTPVWCGFAPLQQAYFGRGVEISLLDDGVQGEHPDIDRSYNYRKDADYVDGDEDGGPGGFQDNHGTQMAGIMVARHNNGGIAGIAPAATLFSTRVFGASDPQQLADAHEHEKSTVDVIVSGFVPGGNYVDISDLLEDAIKSMAERKDVPICYPAGGTDGGARNDYDRLSSHRHTIAIAGVDTISEPGCALIATSAGRDLGTTDRTGIDGADVGDYAFDFTGTSAASACLGGVVALMKDARPDLGWRDYQEIILLTSIPFDNTFAANGAGVFTPLGGLGFKFSYLWGSGALIGWEDPLFGVGAVSLAEVWARLPDSAALYREVDRRKLIRDDIGVGTETYLFDFTRVVPSKQNMRIEHVEVDLEWEEPPNGSPAELLPAYVFLVDPYYTDGPNDTDGIDDRPLPGPPRLAHGSLLSEKSTGINAPVNWTYTSVRHWGLTNTGGFPRDGVPGQRPDEIIDPGVWELDVSVEPFIVTDENNVQLPNHPDSRLTRKLLEATVRMYGTEFNIPPLVLSASVTSSGNPGVEDPRTAFVDEDLLIDNVVFFDTEGDPLRVSFIWQEQNADGLTWSNIGNVATVPAECDFDQFVKIVAKDDIDGTIFDRYFIVTDTDGSTIGFYFQEFGSSSIPAGAAAADRTFPITGVTENEGAAGISADIAAAVNAAGAGIRAVIIGDPDSEPAGELVDGEVAILYPLMFGNVDAPDPGTSAMKMTREVSQDPLGNCFGPVNARLDTSFTQTERKYRVIVTPLDGLREGFRFLSEDIIVNSRPIPDAAHGVQYAYDTDLWIQTVPPETLAPFMFINEFSQGTGDRTTNEEWLEILVNFTTDMRGYRVSNDIAGFDITLTQHPIWEEVQFGTNILIYNGDQRDAIIPPDTLLADFPTSQTWIISASDSTLFDLPDNGDGWGEFSNIDCTPDDVECDGAFVSILTPFGARDPIHGVAFNGNTAFVDAGLAGSGDALFFDGTTLQPGVAGSATDPDAWLEGAAADATPGLANSPNNQTVIDTIIAEAKTSVPTYRFYPGDGSQVIIDPTDGRPVLDGNGDEIPDAEASDIVRGLSIDRKTGIVSGIPFVPEGDVFTIKIQRFHSFSSEIQIYELTVLEAPPLVDSEDEENDGIINLLEEAFGTDAFAAQANVLPVGGFLKLGIFEFPTISFRRLKGGSIDASGVYTVGELVYSVESSTDMETWGPAVAVVEAGTKDTADSPATVQIATFRVGPSLSVSTQERLYFRLRVTRILEE